MVTLAELASGGSTIECLAGPLAQVCRVDVTEADAWHVGRVFARTPRKQLVPLPDFLIRAQAAERGWKHLINDRRRLGWWPDVDYIFGDSFGVSELAAHIWRMRTLPNKAGKMPAASDWTQ